VKVAQSIALSFVLAAGGSVCSQPAPSAKELAAFVKAAKANIMDRMKDPASVQFRNLYVSRSGPLGEAPGGLLILCGQVNAKNTYGGYVGFKDFYAAEVILQRVDPEEADSSFAPIAASFCSAKIKDVK
jgi:hypothetical protein